MHIELDWTVGIIRLGGDEFVGANPGTRYSFVVSVMRKGSEAYLFGAHGEFNRAAYKAVFNILKEAGVKVIRWERLNTEKHREIEVHTS